MPLGSARSTRATRLRFCGRSSTPSFSKSARMWVLTASTLTGRSSALASLVAGVATASNLAPPDDAPRQRPLDQGDPLAVLRQVLDPELLEERPHVGLDRVDADGPVFRARLVGGGGGDGLKPRAP